MLPAQGWANGRSWRRQGTRLHQKVSGPRTTPWAAALAVWLISGRQERLGSLGWEETTVST